MLRTAADFAALASGARQRGDALMTIRVKANGRPEVRFGFATGKNLGGAVVRNRARRRLRAILRKLAPRFAGGQDVMIILRPPAATVTSVQLSVACERLLQNLGVVNPS